MSDLYLFENWRRKPTNTEILASMLINKGLDIVEPTEGFTVYRVQPKITGCEGRNALCYLNRVKGCRDIRGHFKGVRFFGIDIMTNVSEHVKAGDIEIELIPDEVFLWVSPKK